MHGRLMSLRDDTLEAERAVLGAVLVDASAAETALNKLKAENFSNPQLATVFRAVERLAGRGDPVELPSVTMELSEGEKLEEAGGAAFVSMLTDDCPSVANVGWYADKVVRYAYDRRALEAFRLATQGLEDGGDAEAAMAKVSAATGSLRGESQEAVSSILDRLWVPPPIEEMVEPPPRRRWLLQRDDDSGDLVGVFPLGKVGLIPGAGGTGKTRAFFQLAIAIATGRDWLGFFRISDEARTGKVVLFLAEEDAEERRKRLYSACRAECLTGEEIQRVHDNVVIVPLAGHPLPLVREVDGQLIETAEFRAIFKKLEDEGPTSLVVFDPMTRFAAGVESSNDVATAFFQRIERFCEAPGRPSVIVAAHTSQNDRENGKATPRGVSGQIDAARWVLSMVPKGRSTVIVSQMKSNYSVPFNDVELVWDDESLVLKTDAHRTRDEIKAQAARDDTLSKDMNHVLIEIFKRGGFHGRVDDFIKLIGVPRERGRTAVSTLAGEGLIDAAGVTKNRRYFLTDAGLSMARQLSPPPIETTPGGESRPPAGGSLSTFADAKVGESPARVARVEESTENQPQKTFNRGTPESGFPDLEADDVEFF